MKCQLQKTCVHHDNSIDQNEAIVKTPAFKSAPDSIEVVMASCVSLTKIFKVTVALLEVPTQVAGG